MLLSKRSFDERHRYVTSYTFSPLLLGAVRITLGVYTLSTILTVLMYEGIRFNGANVYFSYFTHLSLIGLCAYFWAAGVQTIAFARNSDDSYPQQRWPRALQYLHVLLTSTIVTFPIIVTAVFWALIADSDTFVSTYSSYANISQHLLNAVFALFEIILTNIPVLPWVDLPVTIVMLGGYLGVAYITHLTQGIYVYSFLDPKKQGKKLAVYIVGIAVGQVVVFLLVRYAIILRAWIFRKKGRYEPVHNHRDAKA